MIKIHTKIIKCIDCNCVMSTEVGDSKKIIEVSSLCQRCINKRNGIVGAKDYKDLGIY